MTLSNIFESILNFCDDIINGLKSKWEDFKNWLKNLFTFNLFSSIGSPEFKTNAKTTGSPEYHVDAMLSTYTPPSIAHAEGGIFHHVLLDDVVLTDVRPHQLDGQFAIVFGANREIACLEIRNRFELNDKGIAMIQPHGAVQYAGVARVH